MDFNKVKIVIILKVSVYIGFEKKIIFLFEELYYELNDHDQKISEYFRTTYGNTGQLFRPY